MTALDQQRDGADDNDATGNRLIVCEPMSFHHTQDPITSTGHTHALTSTGGGVMTEPLSFAENQRGELTESSTAALDGGGGKPGQGYPAIREGVQVRRLTPVECERLMGWPDDHTRWRADGTRVSDSTRYRMCGNGIVAPVAEYIGLRLIKATS